MMKKKLISSIECEVKMVKSILWTIFNSIFLIIFNIIFFIGSHKNYTSSAWLSYGFIHFSYIMLLATPLFIKRKSSAILGFPLYLISSVYFIVCFIIGSFFILYHKNILKISIITYLLATGLYFIILVLNIIADNATAENTESHEFGLKYIKDSTLMLKNLSLNTNNENLRKQIEKVYDLLDSSQRKSNLAARELEFQIIDLIELLGKNISDNKIDEAYNTIDKITMAVQERNLQLKSKN